MKINRIVDLKTGASSLYIGMQGAVKSDLC
jgi:hypothetical protein